MLDAWGWGTEPEGRGRSCEQGLFLSPQGVGTAEELGTQGKPDCGGSAFSPQTPPPLQTPPG